MIAYENIVFMQGEEASEPLEILENEGPLAAARFLAQWDMGDGADESEEKPWGNSDSLYSVNVKGAGKYILNVNTRIGYIGLVRVFRVEKNYFEEQRDAIRAAAGKKYSYEISDVPSEAEVKKQWEYEARQEKANPNL